VNNPIDQAVSDAPQDLRDLLVRYVLGDLDTQEKLRVQIALQSDAALAREAVELRRTLDLLPLTTQAAPPAHLRERTLAGARERLADRVVEERDPPSVTSLAAAREQRGRFSWAWAATASLATAGSIACAVLVVDRLQLQRKHDLDMQAATMLLEPNVVKSFSLQGSGSASKASGVVLLDLDAKRASIVVRDLPAVPAGQAYHLWAVLENKRVPCGRFTPTAQGRIVTQFAIPVDSYTSPLQKLILTVEPDMDVAQPSGNEAMSS